MANRNKAKGSEFERDVESYLRWDNICGGMDGAVQLHVSGSKDRGDLEIRVATRKTPPITLQAKAEKSFDLSGYVKAAKQQSVHAGTRWGAAVVKAPRKQTGGAYVVMDLETFRDMMKELL